MALYSAHTNLRKTNGAELDRKFANERETLMGDYFLIMLALIILVVNLPQMQNTKTEGNIATVNVNAIVDRQIKEMAKSELDNQSTEKTIAAFTKQLSIELTQLANEKKAVILVSEAVIAGGTDYTKLVEERIHSANRANRANLQK